MPLSPDDPAVEKIYALRARVAAGEEINVMDEFETFEVTATYFVKALSAGHAKLVVDELVQHTIETHLQPGTFALSGIKSDPEPIPWLTGSLETKAETHSDADLEIG